jgi:hypothetical protein
MSSVDLAKACCLRVPLSFAFIQRFRLHLQLDLRIDISCAQVEMAQPNLNRI